MNLMPAVRAFNRVFDPIAAAINFGYEMASQYDGGEFIGEAYEREFEDQFKRVGEMVATRFNTTYDELTNAVYLDQNGFNHPHMHDPLGDWHGRNE